MGLAEVSKDMAHFKEFKQTVIEKLTENSSEEFIIETVLPHFQEVIGSNRKCQQIMKSKSLATLFEVLEHRDELAFNNIQAIKKIASLLKRIGLEAVFIQYEKLQPQVRCCNICNSNIEPERGNVIVKPVISRPPAPINERKIIEKPQDDLMDSDDEDSSVLQSAFHEVAPEIGVKWKDVARALKFKECDIDVIDYDCRRLIDKVYKMFDMWTQDKGKGATLERFKKALVKARRRDLADKIEKFEKLT